MAPTATDNPIAVGFGTATAEEPPFPAQQHLDAIGGRENLVYHDASLGEGGQVEYGGDGDDAGLPASYDEWSHKQLQAEIDERNTERDADGQINRNGSKVDLAGRLREDDEAHQA